MPRGKVVAPGFIDLHSHGGLVILADGRARAEGPPGHHDRGRRRRRQRLRAVRAARGPRGVRATSNAGLDGRPDIDYDWSSVATLPRALRRHGQPQRRDARRQLAAAHRGARLGRRSGRRRRDRPDARPARATGWPRARSALSSGLDYPPGAYATTDELAALTEAAGRQRRLLPHARPLPARRPLPRPVPRGDRDRPPRRRSGAHHPLLSPRDAPGRSGADARAGRRRPRRGPRRHLRHLSRTSGPRRAC